MMKRCDISRSKLIRDEYIEPDKYIEVNEKTLKVYAVFSKESSYYYLAKLYESSNHFFLVSESKRGTRKKYEAVSSFSGCKEGLEQTIDFMYGLSDEDESYRGLKRIR
ncbi:hypothetical protein N9V13_06760 [Betaproteobacteria bacterium]|nr:hypothetical protein [Betaproteobacteria bacterium]